MQLHTQKLSTPFRVTLQLTKQLFEHLWSQWCYDTQHMAVSLPQALAAQAPGQPLLLSLERWLILLKVCVMLLESKISCGLWTSQRHSGMIG